MGSCEKNKARKTILIVEDNRVNQLTAEALLFEEGFAVNVAESGQEALCALDEKDYDLILMDLEMPGMSGIETIRKIRQLDGTKGKTPIVILSAKWSSEVSFSDAQAADVSGFLYKPFRLADVQLLRDFLEKDAESFIYNDKIELTKEVLNYEILSMLNCAIGQATMIEVIEVALRDIDLAMLNFVRIWKSGDVNRARVAVFSMKGLALNMGGMQLSELCSLLDEELGRCDVPNELLIFQLEKAVEKTKESLKRHQKMLSEKMTTEVIS